MKKLKKMSNPQKSKWKARAFIKKMLELEDCNQQQEWQISYIRQIGHEHIGTGELEKKISSTLIVLVWRIGESLILKASTFNTN